MDTSFRERVSESAGHPEGRRFPTTEAERDMIRQQLDRLLADPSFSNSKRYPRLLKYIVEETVGGRADQLKERTLGIEVFGRGLSYDTNQDPVVRTSAAQVRHRMAQYYQGPGHESEIRIELLPGSYIPQFRYPDSPESVPGLVEELPPPEITEPPDVAGRTVPAPVPAAQAEASPPPVIPAVSSARGRQARFAFVIGIFALAGIAWVAAARWAAPDAVSRFWGPVWDTADAFVICVPGKFPTAETAVQSRGNSALTEPMTIQESLRLNSVAWPDATTLFALAGFIQSRGQAYHVRRAGDSALSDLRTGPAVLVGGLNNQWLMRLTSRYRFTYQNDRAAGEAWIQDAQNPSQREWKVQWQLPYSSFDEDYGIVSRVWDPTTERLVVTASGIASYGTIAAGEFLTNPKYLAMIAERAPAGWDRKSIQVVFATKVFNGNAGPPRILAIHVW